MLENVNKEKLRKELNQELDQLWNEAKGIKEKILSVSGLIKDNNSPKYLKEYALLEGQLLLVYEKIKKLRERYGNM